MAQLAAVPRVPALGPVTLVLMAMLLAGAGGLGAGSPHLKRPCFRMRNGEARESVTPSRSCGRAAGRAHPHQP